MPHAQLQFAIKHQNKQPKHAGEQTQRHYIYRCHPTASLAESWTARSATAAPAPTIRACFHMLLLLLLVACRYLLLLQVLVCCCCCCYCC